MRETLGPLCMFYNNIYNTLVKCDTILEHFLHVYKTSLILLNSVIHFKCIYH